MGSKLLTVKVPPKLAEALISTANDIGVAYASIIRTGIALLIGLCREDREGCLDLIMTIEKLLYSGGDIEK